MLSGFIDQESIAVANTQRKQINAEGWFKGSPRLGRRRRRRRRRLQRWRRVVGALGRRDQLANNGGSL